MSTFYNEQVLPTQTLRIVMQLSHEARTCLHQVYTMWLETKILYNWGHVYSDWLATGLHNGRAVFGLVV